MNAGETIGNLKSGETLTMLVSEDESAGARELYRVKLPARRPGPPLHYHVDFTETFTVIDGLLDIYLGRDRRHVLLKPQQSATVQAGQLHTFANQRDQAAVITVDARPAGGVAEAFQLAYGVANDGGAGQDGLPKDPLTRLLFIRMSHGFVPGIPLALQKAVFAIATFIAKMTGVDRRLSKYFD